MMINWDQRSELRAKREASEADLLLTIQKFCLGCLQIRFEVNRLVRKMLQMKRNSQLKSLVPRHISPTILFFDSAIWKKVYLVTGANNRMPAKPASNQSLKNWSDDFFWCAWVFVSAKYFCSAIWGKVYLVTEVHIQSYPQKLVR